VDEVIKGKKERLPKELSSYTTEDGQIDRLYIYVINTSFFTSLCNEDVILYRYFALGNTCLCIFF